jgi:hypothetical protein
VRWREAFGVLTAAPEFFGAEASSHGLESYIINSRNWRRSFSTPVRAAKVRDFSAIMF